MPDARTCPDCGSPLPARSPEGLCPRCLLGAGMAGATPAPAPAPAPADGTLPFEPGDVLTTIAATSGAAPRILLRDTDGGREPPLIRPGSDGVALRYRIDGEIARGGMGAVLKGRDPDLGREVAVKVLRDDLGARPDMVRRFVEEAQIGGQLQHPGIVPIYELGVLPDRRPFFAMKLVKGQTLAALLGGREGPGSDLPRFLGVVEAIAQTVAYAHARGVIHRDLKPSNVMIGSFGEVQVMDWGLAKVLARGGVVDDATAGRVDRDETVIATARSGDDDPDLSRAGSVLGTPSYMAPEQARGEIDRVDERADVFALGSILCEVLTGEPAFTGRTSGEIQRKAARGDTAEALARLDACAADAELISLAKDCLAGEPDDRPRDASAVANRLTGYLSGVQERLRAAERERAVAEAKAVEERKRRRLTVALAASLVAMMALGGLGGSYLLRQRQARLAAADRRLGEVSALLTQARSRPEDPAGWRAAADAAGHVDRAGLPAAALARLDALARDARAGADAAEADRALMDRLVDIRSAESDDHDGSTSDAAYAEAFRAAGLDVDALGPEAAGAAIRSRPGPVALALAGALDDWSTRRRVARPKDADARRRLLAAARAADPDPRRGELRALLEKPDPKAELAALRALAAQADVEAWPVQTANLLASALGEAGEADAAAGVLRRAVERHPDDVWINYNLARMLAQSRPPRRDEAIRYYTAARALRPETAHDLAHALQTRGDVDEAIAVFRDLARLRPGGRHLACLGQALKDRGRHDEARAALDAAIADSRAAIRLKPDYAQAHSNLGLALLRRGEAAAAEAEFREAIRLKPDYAVAHLGLGDALRRRGEAAAAEAPYREAIRLKPDLVEAHSNLGLALWKRGEGAAAEAEFREVIRLRPDNAEAHSNLGNALRDRGEAAAAEVEYREAIRLKPDLAVAHYNLGNALRDRGEAAAAEAEFREAIRLKPDYAVAHCNLGIVLRGLGKVVEAEAEFREAIRLKPDLAEAHSSLGNVQLRRGEVVEAEAEFREVIRLKPDDAVAHSNLGLALLRRGEAAAAEAEYREAIRLKPDYAMAHYNLGKLLVGLGKRDEAEPEYREAIRLKPDYAEAHCNLGLALRGAGRYAEALEELRRGHELGSRRPGWRYPSRAWVLDCERRAALAGRLPSLLKGDEKPRDAAECLALAGICHDTRHYAASARFYGEALEADPKLGADGITRYNAACAAALSASGLGKDEPPPDAEARAKLRARALAWLRAERDARAKLLDGGKPGVRPAIAAQLKHWQEDADLAGVRDPAALVRLPEAEREDWKALWADVEAMRKRAGVDPRFEVK